MSDVTFTGTPGAPIIVSDSEGLHEAMRRLRAKPAVGLDTEFARSTTFFPKAALFQLSDGVDCWLIDPLASLDLQPLAELLVDEQIVKVMHASSEDIEVLAHTFGEMPKRIFDTQIARAFCGSAFESSYRDAVLFELGVTIDKGETRSDWLQRPLSASQISYAALDAYYLLPIYEKLRKQLDHENRTSWVWEECERRMSQALPITPDLYYRTVKGAWKLSGTQLVRLQRLSKWREELARTLNKPRGRIVKDDVLLNLARGPDKAGAVAASLGPAKRHVSAVLECLRDANGDDSSPPIPEPLSRQESEQATALRELAKATAEELQLAPELLARKKLIEQLFRRDEILQPANPFHGWRASVVPAAIRARIEGAAHSAD